MFEITNDTGSYFYVSLHTPDENKEDIAEIFISPVESGNISVSGGVQYMKIKDQNKKELWEGIIPTSINEPLKITDKGKLQVEYQGMVIPPEKESPPSSNTWWWMILLMILIIVIICLFLKVKQK